MFNELQQDQKDFPHIAQDIQVAEDYEKAKGTAEKIADDQRARFIPKFLGGQVEHGGDFTTMGAYQALENAECENDDMTAYLWQIRKCLDEIDDLCTALEPRDQLSVREIINRVKDDGEKHGN